MDYLNKCFLSRRSINFQSFKSLKSITNTFSYKLLEHLLQHSTRPFLEINFWIFKKNAFFRFWCFFCCFFFCSKSTNFQGIEAVQNIFFMLQTKKFSLNSDQRYLGGILQKKSCFKFFFLFFFSSVFSFYLFSEFCFSQKFFQLTFFSELFFQFLSNFFFRLSVYCSCVNT